MMLTKADFHSLFNIFRRLIINHTFAAILVDSAMII